MKPQTQNRIEEIKKLMKQEEENNFLNGDLWNHLAEELTELERVPSIFEQVSTILNAPNYY